MKAYLVATRAGTEWQLHVTTDSPFPAAGLDRIPEYRVSPIYSARPSKTPEPPDITRTPFIGFFCFEDVFEQIGQLINSTEPTLQNRIWFSIGLPAIIRFSDRRQELEAVWANASHSLRAAEIWTVQDGRIVASPPFLQVPAIVNPAEYSVQLFKDLDEDLQVILAEFAHSLNKGVAKAAQYQPGYLSTYRMLATAVNRSISELRFLAKPDMGPPSFLLAETALALREKPEARQRRTNLLTDQIIQINSALSYVASQAYSGAPPILQHECLYQQHSLFEIGGAVSALASFTRFVEHVFGQYPIDETIVEKHTWLPGIDVCRTLHQYCEGKFDWDKRDVQIDTHLLTTTREALKPHLVLYSGRLGFQESYFALSAAMQVLAAADTTRWSLMTLSHELMHAHVRAILAAVFRSPDPALLGEDAFDKYYRDYRQFIKGNTSTDWKLVESLRFAIFNYCSFRCSLENSGHNPSPVVGEPASLHELPVSVPPGDTMHRLLGEYFKSINEVIVHVLDFQYFYNGLESLYLPLLWHSWATVPAVLEHISDYLLRTLVAIACADPGKPEFRFQNAVSKVRDVLNEIISSGHNDLLIEQALVHLSDDSRMRRLKLLFLPGLYLADIVMSLLRSTKIHGALLAGDSRLRQTDDGYKYLLDTGDWPGVPVHSPVALVADRLRRSIHSTDSDWDSEWRSSWLFVACASAATVHGDCHAKDET